MLSASHTYTSLSGRPSICRHAVGTECNTETIQTARLLQRNSTSVNGYTLVVYSSSSSFAPSLVRYFWSSEACVSVV